MTSVLRTDSLATVCVLTDFTHFARIHGQPFSFGQIRLGILALWSSNPNHVLVVQAPKCTGNGGAPAGVLLYFHGQQQISCMCVIEINSMYASTTGCFSAITGYVTPSPDHETKVYHVPDHSVSEVSMQMQPVVLLLK